MWKLKTLLNNSWVKKEVLKGKKELNANENTKYQNIWDVS